MLVSIAPYGEAFFLGNGVPVLPVPYDFLHQKELPSFIIDLCKDILSDDVCSVLMDDFPLGI